MALMCGGVRLPAKIVTGLSPVVASPKFLQKDVTDSEESIDHAFEGMPQTRHDYQSGKRDGFLRPRQLNLEGGFYSLLVLRRLAISKGSNRSLSKWIVDT